MRLIAPLVALAAATTAHADLESDLADLSSRAAYGFYVRDAAVVAAALDALGQLGADDGRVHYGRAHAALRLAQLTTPRTKAANALLDECISSAEEAAELMPASAEPWILSAACSALAVRAEPVKAILHNRRVEHALARAKAADPGNPRLALVETWRIADDAAQVDAASAAMLLPMLEAAAAAYPERARAEPQWGEAETLALLGVLYLRKGDVRAARDVIEHALIVAPGYEDALELKRRLELEVLSARTGGSL